METPIAPEHDFHHPRLVWAVLMLFCAALLALAIFQSAALVTLSYDWPPSVFTERAVVMIETWHGWMEALGPGRWTAGIGESVEEGREVLMAP
ncbi:MAG: hypothetical protein AAFO61_10465 [Pseudomonadota bacterium]